MIANGKGVAGEARSAMAPGPQPSGAGAHTQEEK